jgi:hypothetical protein
MLGDRLRRLAEDYVTVQQTQEQEFTAGETEDRIRKVYEQFVKQLETEGIGYFDEEDAGRIAVGIVDGTFNVLYHKCGRAIILDGDAFRIRGGELAGYTIEDCPGCGKPLNAFDLYDDPGGPTRNLLREAGLYPTSDSLVLMEDSGRRAAMLEALWESLNSLGDGDLLATYAVVAALIKDSEEGSGGV